MQPVLAACLFK